MGVAIQGLPDPYNITTWSVDEDITPIDPGSTDGGVGQITFAAPDWPLSRHLRNTDVTLEDSDYGTTIGVVRSVGNDDGVMMSATADSELGKFVAQRNAPPFSVPLSELFQNMLVLAGVYVPLDFQATKDPTVHAPGFVGNVWDHIKMLCSAYQVELALVSDRVVVRDLHSRTLPEHNVISSTYNVNTQDAALAVDVAYYNNRSITKGEVYPVKGEDPSIYSVEAGEIVEYDISINASLSQVYQPVCSESVGPGDRSGTNGVYTVVGNDNLPIKPKQWLDSGGRVDVSLGTEPGQLLLRITGAQIDHLSPFRIAESAGGTDYNSLHITGDGVAWDQESVRIFTGANPLNISSELGPAVENPYINTRSQALQTGIHSAIAASGSQARITVSTDKIPGLEQSFGNVIGARVKQDDAFYRVTSVSTGPEGMTYDAVLNTMVRDFNEAWGNRTVREFNDLWQDMTAGMFSVSPLRTPEPMVSGEFYEFPISEWALSGGAVYDEEEECVVLPVVGARVTSPWVRVDKPRSLTCREEWWAEEPDSRGLTYIFYGDETQAVIDNNGNGQIIPAAGEWAEVTHTLSANVISVIKDAVYVRWDYRVTSSYGTPGTKVRKPALRVLR